MESESPPSSIHKQKPKNFVRQNLLIILTVAAVILGAGLGFALKAIKPKWTQREVMYVNFVGDVFLNMLKAMILPLIVASVVTAISNMDLSLSGKIARRAILFYFTTTFASVVLGIVLVVAIRPGDFTTHYNPTADVPQSRNVTTVDTLLDLVRYLFPPNVVQATIQQSRTVLTPPKDDPNNDNIYEWKISHENVYGMNIMGLVVVATVLGITLAKIGEAGRPLINLFDSIMAVTMAITTTIIWLAPLGIFSLVAAKIVELDDILDTLIQLGMYFFTVMLGLMLQGFIVLPFLYFIMTRKNPFVFIRNLGQALTTAFGTGSSSASLPITMRCIEENNGVDKRISRFCLPIGATINMDGTALYEAVAAIFIAQVRHVDLNFGGLVAVSITATAASIGAAGIPQAGLVTMVMVLDACGLPAEDISLILAVDWLLDRCRTTINVIGDSVGAGIVDHLSKKEIEAMNQKPDNTA